MGSLCGRAAAQFRRIGNDMKQRGPRGPGLFRCQIREGAIRDRTLGLSEAHIAPPHLQRLHGPPPGPRADPVIDGGNASAIGQARDLGRELGAVIIDDMGICASTGRAETV